MARIVILGAGIGGLSIAMELRQLIHEDEEVFVISETPSMNFNPANHLVAFNASAPQDIGIELALLLRQHSIGFIQRSAIKIHPEQNQVELDGGIPIDYDILVIATGPKPAFDDIPGFGPDGYTSSVCRIDDAVVAGQSWEDFLSNPGPVITGAVQEASNFAAAYEYTMIMDAHLRKRGIREQIEMTFVTSEPYIGHLGLGGIGDSKLLLENEFRHHNIQWITNAKVNRIDKNAIYISEHNEQGIEKQQHQLPFKHCMMMPAYRGVDAVRVKKLATDRGFILVDKHQRNPSYPNIYAVGVCVEVSAQDKTPIPVGAQKNGYMIESMVRTAAHNIRAQLDGLEPFTEADLNPYPQSHANAQIYKGDGHFDKTWLNPVSGLYAFSLWNQLHASERN